MASEGNKNRRTALFDQQDIGADPDDARLEPTVGEDEVIVQRVTIG